MVLVGPVLVSGVLWLLLGYALPDSAVWVRMGAAAVPLLLVPIALVMRLAAVPAALHCAATERIAELEQRLADLESTRVRTRATLMRFYSDAQPVLQATLRSPFSRGEAGSGNRNLSEISPRGETTDPPPPPSQGISSTDGPRAQARTITEPKYRAAWAFIGNVQAHFGSSIRPRMRLDMAQDRSPARASRLHLPENLILLVPGFLVSVVVAVAARFLSDHYGAPAMLMALLLGIAFHFLAEEGRCVPGIAVSAKGVLRFGVALLGIRVSVELMASLGFGVICLVVAGVVLTILFGMLGARLLRRGWRFALLTGGAVAICGASAAMAIAAVLPKNEHSERNLIFTVLGVTVLSTIAMIVYPVITSVAGLGPLATGVFLGGTIYDVAQVVGAGFSISDETGETATLVKLFRVTLLAPVVLCFSLAIRARSGAEDAGSPRPPLVPGFVLAFLALATVNSIGLVPAVIRNFVSDLSRWALLVAIAAVGMKTSLRTILDVGGQAIVLIVAETTFLAIFILAGLHLLN